MSLLFQKCVYRRDILMKKSHISMIRLWSLWLMCCTTEHVHRLVYLLGLDPVSSSPSQTGLSFTLKVAKKSWIQYQWPSPKSSKNLHCNSDFQVFDSATMLQFSSLPWKEFQNFLATDPKDTQALNLLEIQKLFHEDLILWIILKSSKFGKTNIRKGRQQM